MRAMSVLSVFLVLTAAPALAQDAARVDPAHYKVEFENDQVRVLRITYGPNEKSVMHSHPAGVVIFLTDGKVRFTLPDGQTLEDSSKAGETRWADAGSHLPQNLENRRMEVILVEFKTRSPGTR